MHIYDSLNTVRQLVAEGSLSLQEGDTIHTWFAEDYFGNKCRDDWMEGTYRYVVGNDEVVVDGGACIDLTDGARVVARIMRETK